MYPGTIFNWYDNSKLIVPEEIPVIENNNAKFMVVSSFDKGPEDLREVTGQEFFNLYGYPTFDKHGQNGIQASRIINAGGTLIVKRVTASDATLSNVILCANIITSNVQKKNEDGELLYIDPDTGEEITLPEDAGEDGKDYEPATEESSKIKWTAETAANAKTFEELEEAAEDLFDDEEGVYPLFIYTDNGKGATSKAVRLIPDYNTSKNMGNTYYNLNIYEGTTIIEKEVVSFDPTIVYDDSSYGIDRSTCYQIQGQVTDKYYDAYVNKVADITSIDASILKQYDLVYGYTNKGETIPGFVIDTEGVDLNAIYGIELKSGSNGEFGNKPAGTSAWTEAIRSVYAGEDTDMIWDVDTYKIAAVLDANFPMEIKNAIANFVTWREDCMYFRDFGTGLTTYSDIKNKKNSFTINNRYISDYSTSYTIKDPSTKKNIEVTMMYDLAAILVNSINNGIASPLAGTFNGCILSSAIKDTINFTPIITPTVNQKEAFDDLKINYAIFQNNQCVIQSCYTSLPENTELSYCNNVMAIQAIIRAIRTQCPRNRYRLSTKADLTEYATDINNLLEDFKDKFYVLNFVYTEDKLKASQKIFYASLEVAFGQWAQTEIFDIHALNSGNM